MSRPVFTSPNLELTTESISQLRQDFSRHRFSPKRADFLSLMKLNRVVYYNFQSPAGQEASDALTAKLAEAERTNNPELAQQARVEARLAYGAIWLIEAVEEGE